MIHLFSLFAQLGDKTHPIKIGPKPELFDQFTVFEPPAPEPGQSSHFDLDLTFGEYFAFHGPEVRTAPGAAQASRIAFPAALA